MFSVKRNVLVSAIIATAISINVQAEDEVNSYLTDSAGNVVTSGAGDCWRTSDKTSVKLEECGYAKPEPVTVEVEAVVAPTAMTVTAKKMEKIVIGAAMLFDFDSSTLSADAKAVIDERIATLKGSAKLTSIMKVIGHTDSTGPEAYNMKLSQARAQAVADYIAENSYRVKADDMEVVGMGESAPIASNDTKEGRQKNRRVEIYAEGEMEK